MASYIHSISTAVPETSYSQEFLCRQMKKYIADDRRLEHLIHRIYHHSGISKRHTVVKDFISGSDQSSFYFGTNRSINTPSTGRRNRRFTEHATPLLQKTGSDLLEQNPSVGPADITHVITVSCTGFFAPGPDLAVVQSLDLPLDTRRYNLGFMGCYAALPALQLAHTICEADPDSCVMVICLELCSLHFQINRDYDNLVAASLFADGAAGALVSGHKNQNSGVQLRMDQFHTTYLEEGEEDMAWSIGDTGFEMILSSYVPRIIDANLREALTPLIEKISGNLQEVDYWALHPGGKAIIDKLESNFGLAPSQLSASREVLSRYGNMSSATILFVMRHIMEQTGIERNQQLIPLAFGPGLTIESGLFTAI